MTEHPADHLFGKLGNKLRPSGVPQLMNGVAWPLGMCFINEARADEQCLPAGMQHIIGQPSSATIDKQRRTGRRGPLAEVAFQSAPPDDAPGLPNRLAVGLAELACNLCDNRRSVGLCSAPLSGCAMQLSFQK